MSDELIKQEPAVYGLAILNNKVDITSRIDEIVKSVKQEIADLKLAEMEAIEENKAAIRNKRAELNKKLAAYKDDIKKIDNFINSGLDELKSQFKTKIEVLFKETDATLKEKIDTITNEQLKENEEYSKTYYESKFKSMPLRKGAEYADIPWSFGFNSSKKSIRETCDNHFDEVDKALKIIETHEFSSELESLWTKNKWNLGDALIELQQQIALAEKLMKQKTEALEKERVRLADEAAKLNEAQRVVQEVKEPVAVAPVMLSVEPITEYNLIVEVTDKQLERLINFMTDEEIDFRLNE